MEQQLNELIARMEGLVSRIDAQASELRQLMETIEVLSEITKLGLINNLMTDATEALARSSSNVQTSLEDALSALYGVPLTGIWKDISGAHLFEFGPRHAVLGRSGKERTVTDYALRVHCDWQVYYRDRVILESGSYASFGESLELFFHLTKDAMLIIESISRADRGDLMFQFKEDYRLRIQADQSIDDEYWRFYIPMPQQQMFVFAPTGLRLGQSVHDPRL